MKIDLKGLNAHEMEEWAVGLGLETYRGRQVRNWLLNRMAGSFDEMTNLPKSLRSLLNEKAYVTHLENVKTLVSKDGTRKYLFKLIDGFFIESVLIPERGHFTLCISSQAGCALGCRFCFTAQRGLKRNLSSSEIIDQVIQIKKSMDEPDRLTNIVLMGMGEPLANYDAVLRTIHNIVSKDGMNFSHHKVTLSTCGLIPQIKQLGRDITVNLAISLNAADNETRNFLMPVNRKYPLENLISVCKGFPLPNKRMITFEYILIKDINNNDSDALKLVKLLSGIRSKINLIPLNPHPGSDLTPPSLKNILHFQEILIDNHFTAIIRKSKGNDIMAACGQLSGSK